MAIDRQINTKDSGTGKFMEQPKHHIVSTRISDQEKALLEEMTRSEGINTADLIRRALTSYASIIDVRADQAGACEQL